MASILGWHSKGADGEARSERSGQGVSASSSVREIVLRTTDGEMQVRVRDGERVGVFTRRRQGLTLNGAVGPVEDTVVVEIAPDPERPDRFVRLYLGREVVLSTEDLYG